jgi:hypothetical protein
MPLGTHTIADLRANRFQSVVEYGLDTINTVLQNDLAVFNAITNEITNEIAVTSPDRQRIYGTSVAGETMQRGDEFDRALARKPPRGGVTTGFPLYKYPYALGWTEDYFKIATPADVAETQIGAQTAYTNTLYRDVREALFTPTNRTVRDEFDVPQIDLTVRALVNADSNDIPNGPNGETFTGSSHTHYDWIDSATPTYAALAAQVLDVTEHGHVSDVRIYINSAAEAAVRAFTSAQFQPFPDPRLVYRDSTTPSQTLMMDNYGNRAIGLLGSATVWVKQWIPAGYTFCFAAGDMRKPLVRRIHRVAGFQGLRIAARLQDYPLVADQMESFIGFGVWNRTNGHVLYYASGASAYVAPTL